jgi:hypothetical protein
MPAVTDSLITRGSHNGSGTAPPAPRPRYRPCAPVPLRPRLRVSARGGRTPASRNAPLRVALDPGPRWGRGGRAGPGRLGHPIRTPYSLLWCTHILPGRPSMPPGNTCTPPGTTHRLNTLHGKGVAAHAGTDIDPHPGNLILLRNLQAPYGASMGRDNVTFSVPQPVCESVTNTPMHTAFCASVRADHGACRFGVNRTVANTRTESL